MKIQWIHIREALKISNAYKDAPHTKTGVIWAGKKGGFIRKGPDGFHWEYNLKILKQYLELRQRPNVSRISKQLDRSVYFINGLMEKLGIQSAHELGLTYLEYEDASKLINYYTEHHNDRNKKDEKKPGPDPHGLYPS